MRNWFLTYLTTKQPCFHFFPCRVAPKRPLVYSRSVSRDDRRRVRYENRRHSGGAEEAAGDFICVGTIRWSHISILPGPLSSSWVVNSRHDARATYTAKPQTTAQLEAASSWTREAGGASKAIGTVPAMRPRALLGASCESNGSKKKALKSGVVGFRAFSGQRLKQADFTFQDPPAAWEPPRTYPRRIPAPCSSTSVIFRFRLLHPPFLRHFRHAQRHEDRGARTLFCDIATQEAGFVFLTNIKTLDSRVKNVG